MNVNNIHDKLFRATFSHAREVATLIRHFFPKELAAQIDLASLKNENTSFVNEDLQEYFSDLIYSCAFGTGKERVLISLLLEHKSYVVNPYPQLLRYLVEGYDYQYKQFQKKKKEKEPFKYRVIIPVIIYHGEQKWQYRPFSDYFDFGKNELLARFIPTLDYPLIDLANFTKEEIFAIELSFALTALQLMKHYKQEEFVLQHYKELFIFGEVSNGNKFHKVVILYMLYGFGIEVSTVKNIMEKLPATVKSDFVSTYDMLIEEGKIKGVKIGFAKGEKVGLTKGEKKGKLKANLLTGLRFIEYFPIVDDKQIALFANVKIDLIKKLKKAIAAKKDSEIIKVARAFFLELEEYQKKDFKTIDKYTKEVLAEHRKVNPTKN